MAAYLNTPMRKTAGIDKGDTGNIEITYDPAPRTITMHPKLKASLAKNKKAKNVFGSVPPSRQKEINRYMNFLKTKESIDRNISKVIVFLSGRDRFADRDKP
jgi:Bacteriocin-protection, YdeI or OmpD-Associated